MGCGPSKELSGGRETNARIDMQLKVDRARAQQEVKCLLLGAGESGKSTILKQMQLIHGLGYSTEERDAYREVIFSNLVQSIKVILAAMGPLGILLHDHNLYADVALVSAQPHQLEDKVFPAELARSIARLWRDPGVQQCFARSREYQLNDSAKFYLDALERIAHPAYMPSDQDILRSRVKTTGIVETVFRIGDLTYRMFDVGGQRSERKKWIHCFENVTALVFLVAISEYDQVLIEDEKVNRMEESLTLFESICNSRWFIKTSIILFLNKIDLFKDKVAVSPISRYFPDFPGPDTFQDGCQFFLHKFTNLNKSSESQIYAHFTCATDTKQIQFVMAAVNDIIVRNNLKNSGLL